MSGTNFNPNGFLEGPRRSIWGLIVLTLLAAAHFAMRWGDGVTYQGSAHTIALLSLNVVVLVVGWGMLWRALRRRSFRETLAAHAVVVGWLVWIAFPWLGELI